ncbi:MAG: TOBE domain-containing protein [Bacteriovoracaceae bacterium]
MKQFHLTSTFDITSLKNIKLIEAISRFGSIKDAASNLGISYRTAWNTIQVMNRSVNGPLIETINGGKNGGGAILTIDGKKILIEYQMVMNELNVFSLKLNNNIEFYNLKRRSLMRTSARNQFLGSVIKVKKGAVNSEVEILINGGDHIIASITNESVKSLKLKKSVEVWTLIKASWVILSCDQKITLSARNCFKGAVTHIKKGAINSEIELSLESGNKIISTITNESLKDLKLKKE